MAGKKCPACGKQTLYTSGDKLSCSCGFVMVLPPNDGKGGRGLKCPKCGKYQLFRKERSGVCHFCGATCEFPKA